MVKPVASIVSAKTGIATLVYPAETPETRLASLRATMTATRLQARLALGPDACAILDAAAVDPLIPWAMREAIKSATVWHRTEPEIDELAWLLDLSPDEIDNLFTRAMAL